MALKRNMTRDEMIKFIDDELVPQVQLEIQNWIKPRKKQGGYFVVVRQILCIVDFLGAAFSGYPLSQRKDDKKGKKIATSEKAVRFIITFFEPKKIYQAEVVWNLYNMYRHGLVHLYQPKILKLRSKGKLLWFFYKGNRHVKKIEMDTDKGKIIFKNINHLEIFCNDPNRVRYYLPVSIDSIYEDFKNAIQNYKNKLINTKYLQRNWRTTVNAICKPQ